MHRSGTLATVADELERRLSLADDQPVPIVAEACELRWFFVHAFGPGPVRGGRMPT